MTEGIVEIIGNVAYAVITGVLMLVAVALTNKANSSRLRSQLDRDTAERNKVLLRERGEELYELVDKWLNSLFGYYLGRSFVMQGKLSLNECLEMEVEQKRETGNFGRIEMIIDVYFASLRESYDQTINHRGDLNEIIVAHKKSYEEGMTDGQKFLGRFVKSQVAVEETGDELKRKIREVVRAL